MGSDISRRNRGCASIEQKALPIGKIANIVHGAQINNPLSLAMKVSPKEVVVKVVRRIGAGWPRPT